MTEHGYIRAIHQHLPRQVYCWKIADRFRRGVPDCWYSGDRASMFVEYKYLRQPPARSFTPALTDIQKLWLYQRAQEGRNILVIVGCPLGGTVITPDQLYKKHKVDTWLAHKQIAQHITQIVSTSTAPAP